MEQSCRSTEVEKASAFALGLFAIKDQEAYAAEMEWNFIAIKPDGVSRGLETSCVEQKFIWMKFIWKVCLWTAIES